MIARKIPKKKNIPDNYKKLADYIAAAKEPGEKLDRFWIANCNAGEKREDLDLAIMEINAIRRMKPAIDDKSYHMIVSFRPGEKEHLSDQDLKDIAGSYASALGFGEHQYVAATHINTDNFHMHIAFNKVHPQTLKVHTPFNDYKIRDRVSRQLEKKYGLFVDNGMSPENRNSQKLSSEARTFESHTWQESFQTHVLGQRDDILERAAKAKNWQALHEALADYDITLKKRGNGFVLLSPDGQSMKASALDRTMSKAALEKKFGAFTPPKPKHQKAGQKQRTKHRYRPRPTLRHPAMPPLWRKYLGTRNLTPTRTTLLGRTLSNWKLFLISEAWQDPLAMVMVMAHQELLHVLFDNPKDRTPTVPKAAAPALKTWRETASWAKAGSLTWLADTRFTGRGCRVDDQGNLAVPFRDANGHMQAIRLYAPDGKSTDIGDTHNGILTHMINRKETLTSGPVIFSSDYADAVKIHDATRRPVVMVANPAKMNAAVDLFKCNYPKIKPVVRHSQKHPSKRATPEFS
jgi:hypothetical protein